MIFSQPKQHHRCPICREPLDRDKLLTVPRESRFATDIESNWRRERPATPLPSRCVCNNQLMFWIRGQVVDKGCGADGGDRSWAAEGFGDRRRAARMCACMCVATVWLSRMAVA